MSHKNKCILLLSLALASLALLFLFVPPIAQPLSYHNFADQRPYWHIPNFCDVVSNLPLIVVGAVGFGMLAFQKEQMQSQFIDRRESMLFAAFFLFVALTGLGSWYYHLAPNNSSLFWDRAPIGMVFMSLFSIFLVERVGVRVGLRLAVPLILFGFCSVLYWQYTEQLGRGDLRLYAWVQFFPVVMLPILLLYFPARYTAANYLWLALLWSCLARIGEMFDARIFHLLQGTVSGHTLKHICMSVGVYYVLQYVRKRQPMH